MRVAKNSAHRKSQLFEIACHQNEYSFRQKHRKTDKHDDYHKQSQFPDLSKTKHSFSALRGKDSKDCTLILTEGDSAKALAIAGLAVIGRDKFGVGAVFGNIFKELF